MYFYAFVNEKDMYATIARSSNLIKGFERTTLVLLNGASLDITNVLYSPKFRRNLLRFKNICLNRYHLKTADKGGKEYLYTTRFVPCQKYMLESFPCMFSWLYCIHIKVMESHTV